MTSQEKIKPSVGKSIRDFSYALITQNIGKPISIEITEDAARSMKEEFSMLTKYADTINMPHNELLYLGILIIAPKNFAWYTERPSSEDFK